MLMDRAPHSGSALDLRAWWPSPRPGAGQPVNGENTALGQFSGAQKEARSALASDIRADCVLLKTSLSENASNRQCWHR